MAQTETSYLGFLESLITNLILVNLVYVAVNDLYKIKKEDFLLINSKDNSVTT